MADFDKIEKLIRLANNNPNENEANLAARKACRMLEKVRFKGSSGSGSTRQQTTNPGNNPFTRDYTRDWDGFGTNSRSKSREAAEKFWREREQRAKADKERADKFNAEREREEKARQDIYDEFVKGNDFDFENLKGRKVNYSRVNEDPLYNTKGKSPRYNRDEKKILKCIKCGQEVETGFVGPPQIFTCTPCQWIGD